MTSSLMEQEARQIPSLLEQQLLANLSISQHIATKLRQLDPSVLVFIGRGSSDHAGVFGKYLIEIEAGIPVSAAAPSVSSIYAKKMKFKQAAVIIISQSGASPDILTQAQMARANGGYCIALVNDEHSPLAQLVDDVVPIGVGKELAVAATKSYFCTLTALIQLVGHWSKNTVLLNALNALPTALEAISAQTPQLECHHLKNRSNLIILGRGFGYAIAKEMALKLKEICSIHAEAFSSAEFLHGPIALTQHPLTLLSVCVDDESLSIHQDRITALAAQQLSLIPFASRDLDIHPRLSPLLIMQRFYLDLAQAAPKLGLDPDHPQGLNKITRTL